MRTSTVSISRRQYLVFVVALVLLVGFGSSLDNGLALTPPSEFNISYLLAVQTNL